MIVLHRPHGAAAVVMAVASRRDVRVVDDHVRDRGLQQRGLRGRPRLPGGAVVEHEGPCC